MIISDCFNTGRNALLINLNAVIKLRLAVFCIQFAYQYVPVCC